MSRNVFNDGHTRKGYIAAVPGLHDEMRFEFRFLMPETLDALEHAAEQAGPGKSVVHLAAAIAGKHLVAWSEVDAEGKPVPITLDTVRHLPVRLFNQLYRIIAGREPADLDPKGGNADTEKAIAAANAIEIPGAHLLEADAKN